MEAKDKPEPPPPEASLQASKEDVLLVHGVTPDGKGLAVLRKHDDKLELGAVHPLCDGQPIHGEVVRLKPRKECPLVCDVEVEFAANSGAESTAQTTSRASSRKGPPRVTSDRYRENWDAIWKPLPKKRELSN